MEKCISGKQVYATQQMAEDALIDAHARFDYAPGSGPVNIYQCEDCGYFHLTSKGQINEKLSQFMRDGKLKLMKEANRWLDKFKKY